MLRALKVSYSDVGEGGVAGNCAYIQKVGCQILKTFTFHLQSSALIGALKCDFFPTDHPTNQPTNRLAYRSTRGVIGKLLEYFHLIHTYMRNPLIRCHFLLDEHVTLSSTNHSNYILTGQRRFPAIKAV